MKHWKKALLCWLCLALLWGCGRGAASLPRESAAPSAPTAPAETLPDCDGTEAPTYNGIGEELYTDGGTGDSTTAGENWLDEDGSYTTAADVALYIHIYGDLPENFITKNEARDLGWSGGGLESYAPGKCIGGDYFGNREGLLPEGNYRECDVNTLGENSRGAERLVWDEAGNIYYTADHYESFELVYAANETG